MKLTESNSNYYDSNVKQKILFTYDNLVELIEKKKGWLSDYVVGCLNRILRTFFECDFALDTLREYLLIEKFNKEKSFECYYYIDGVYHRTYVIEEMVIDIVRSLFFCRRYYRTDIPKKKLLKRLGKIKRYRRINELFHSAKVRFDDMFNRRHNLVHNFYGTAESRIYRKMMLRMKKYVQKRNLDDKAKKTLQQHLEYNKLLDEYNLVKNDISQLQFFFIEFCYEIYRLLEKS